MTKGRSGYPLSESILLAAILIVAAAVRFWGLDFGLPHTQARPDETHIIDVTLYFLRGNFKPPFYDYPWLYMWVLTGLYCVYYLWGAAAGTFTTLADVAASWPIHWEPFFLISRGLSAVAGTATVIVVYRLGRRLWDPATGLVAALFLSLAFLHARDSHFGTTDVTMTLLIVAAVSLLLAAHQTARRALFAAAGLVAGLAVATKYNAVFLGVPFAVVLALHAIDAPGRRLSALLDRRIVWFGLPFAAALAIGIPFVVLDVDRFWDAMQELAHSMRYGQGAVNPENGWRHHLTFSLRFGIGLPLLVAALTGAAVLAVREPRTAAILLAFPLSYFLAAGSLGNLFFRYMIPVVPFLCLTAAWLVNAGTRLLVPWKAAPAAAALVLVLPSAISLWHFDRIVSQTDNRVVIADWFRDHVPPGETVLQSGSHYGHAQIDNRIWVPWVWDRGRQIFRVHGRPAEGRPDWILVQESPLPSMTQAIVTEFLRDGYELAWQFTALSMDDGRVYDLQDAFFVPFAGFDGVRRPGPNFTLYKRTRAPARHEPAPTP